MSHPIMFTPMEVGNLKLGVSKLDPAFLAELHAEIRAKAALEPKPELAVDPLPPKVKAFWFHEEPAIPPWQSETAAKREKRDEAQSRGCWTG
jgi:hypothetical protein